MAIDRTPRLKRCQYLGISPSELGLDKKTTRTSSHAGKKSSQYGLQLKEKQKAKFIYGVLEKQFRGYYDLAARERGKTGETLMVLLEQRLDNIVFRMGWSRTRPEARQMVVHKFVTVNGKIVNIPSYQVAPGDVIEIVEGKKNSQRMKEILEVTAGRISPVWMQSDIENLHGTILETPTRDQIDVPVDETLIIELYSK
jgi:small subunit ribosomal protein S4